MPEKTYEPLKAGDKFNMLTAVSKAPSIAYKEHWNFICDCGTPTIKKTYAVVNSIIKSCGCLMPFGSKERGRIGGKDWAGQKFEKLTFIKPINQKCGKSIMWECLCDCGNTTFVVPRNIRGVGKKKPSKHDIVSCGCTNDNNRRKYDPMMSSAIVIWKQVYGDGHLTFDDFYTLSQQNCYYCGEPPSNCFNRDKKNPKASEYQLEEGNFIYNGLDRIDSTKIHSIENLVPACIKCNWMKCNSTFGEFLFQIEKIYHHLSETSYSGISHLPLDTAQIKPKAIIVPALRASNRTR